MLSSSVVNTDDGKIKLTFGWLFNKRKGLNPYRNTSMFVYGFLLIGVATFFSNYAQDEVVPIFTVMGWKTIPLLITTVSFAIFCLTKFFINLFPFISPPKIVTNQQPTFDNRSKPSEQPTT